MGAGEGGGPAVCVCGGGRGLGVGAEGCQSGPPLFLSVVLCPLLCLSVPSVPLVCLSLSPSVFCLVDHDILLNLKKITI